MVTWPDQKGVFMCGVAGVVRFDGSNVEVDLLTKMTDLLQHRGPDDSGFWCEGHVGFGHRRLSIIDVAGSPQPMTSASGRYVIVFNGEIINYEAVRERFSLTCKTSGDTEVLLELLELRGVAGLSELRGQFAFAVYDREKKSLLLGRDRLGIIPLFVAKTTSGVAFASEPKALIPFAGQLQLDEEHLAELLMFRTVGAPATPFVGVEKVLPGHWMQFDASGTRTTGAYWNLNQMPQRSPLTPEAAVDELDRLLRQSVIENLVADVPVGAYLSGGVDSSLIVAHAAAVHGSGLKTFSAAFDVGFDERPYAKSVAERYGTDHYEVVVSASEYFEELQRLTWFRDSPISEPADVAVAALARLASQHVKVVLSGEGSDELFGGYSKYKLAKVSALGNYVPGVLRAKALPLVEQAIGKRIGPGVQVLRALQGSTEWIRHASWFGSFTEQEIHRLTKKTGAVGRSDVVLSGDAIKRMGTVDLTAWLSDNLLERGDRMTMASSIELRPPFLDPRIIDFARSLPSSITNKGNVPKWVVREAAKRYVDAANVDRPKTGFKVPLSEWFRTDLHDRVHELLLGSGTLSKEFIAQAEVQRILENHQSERVDAWRQIWALVTFEMFCRQLVNPQPRPSARRITDPAQSSGVATSA